MELFYKILVAVLTAVLPVLTGFLCDMIHKAAVRYRQKAEDERIQSLVWEIDEAARCAVEYVNQTFVDELKKVGVFGEGEEYGQEAFEEAFQTVVETISDDALDYLEQTFGDIRKYLTVKIENYVREFKKPD